MTLDRTREWRLAAREKSAKAVIEEEIVGGQSLLINEEERIGYKMPGSNQDRRIYARLWQRFSLKPHTSIMSPHFYNNHVLLL